MWVRAGVLHGVYGQHVIGAEWMRCPLPRFSLYMFQTFCAPFQELVHVRVVANNPVLSLCTQRPTFLKKVRRLATGEVQQGGTRLFMRTVIPIGREVTVGCRSI